MVHFSESLESGSAGVGQLDLDLIENDVDGLVLAIEEGRLDDLLQLGVLWQSSNLADEVQLRGGALGTGHGQLVLLDGGLRLGSGLGDSTGHGHGRGDDGQKEESEAEESGHCGGFRPEKWVEIEN